MNFIHSWLSFSDLPWRPHYPQILAEEPKPGEEAPEEMPDDPEPPQQDPPLPDSGNDDQPDDLPLHIPEHLPGYDYYNGVKRQLV